MNEFRVSHPTLVAGLFHRGFKEAINGTEWTKEDLMKRQIGYAIENIKAVRGGMFTPDQAFDRIIREQVRLELLIRRNIPLAIIEIDFVSPYC